MGVNSITAMAKNPTVDIRIILTRNGVSPIDHYRFGGKKPGDPDWEKEPHELQ